MNSDNEKNGELRIDGVRITNPGKLLFEDPPITKEDVVRYYASMADRMLPYASGRILSIVRCPRGADSACFFKKHPGPSTPGVRTVDIPTWRMPSGSCRKRRWTRWSSISGAAGWTRSNSPT